MGGGHVSASVLKKRHYEVIKMERIENQKLV